jgi:3'-phosphoadenosine 5'-phosphosulfate sulfotransferase (PAPS reductase)/FAD synthetase
VYRHWDEKYAQSMGIIDTMLLKYPLGKQMIGYSGGKDSTVVLYLLKKECESFGLDFHKIVVVGPVLMDHYTGGKVEYPETIEFCKKVVADLGLNYLEEVSTTTFWELAEKYGLPTFRGIKTVTNCCERLKIAPMVKLCKQLKTKVVYLGTTAPESHQRQLAAYSHGDTYWMKKWGCIQCCPILYWTEAEVWRYTHDENIPYNTIYDKGASRCGCATCTAYEGWETDMLRLSPENYVKVNSLGGER